MFVISKLDVDQNVVVVVSVHYSYNTAIEYLHKNVSKYKDEDDYEVQIINENRIEIIERNPGWIFNPKNLIEVYQIIEHKDILVDRIGSETPPNSEEE